jgi:hypothetical protein
MTDRVGSPPAAAQHAACCCTLWAGFASCAGPQMVTMMVLAVLYSYNTMSLRYSCTSSYSKSWTLVWILIESMPNQLDLSALEEVDTNEAQSKARRLSGSTAGARSGAARASRSARRPAGPADFWVLEQHLPWPLCACATVLPHVAGFSVIVSCAPPVSGARHAP